jgi:hypothetical protein
VSEDKKGAKGGEGNGKEEKEEDVTEGMSDEEKRFFDEVMAEVKHWDGELFLSLPFSHQSFCCSETQ